jgi:hypothetical protein
MVFEHPASRDDFDMRVALALTLRAGLLPGNCYRN